MCRDTWCAVSQPLWKRETKHFSARAVTLRASISAPDDVVSRSDLSQNFRRAAGEEFFHGKSDKGVSESEYLLLFQKLLGGRVMDRDVRDDVFNTVMIHARVYNLFVYIYVCMYFPS